MGVLFFSVTDGSPDEYLRLGTPRNEPGEARMPQADHWRSAYAALRDLAAARLASIPRGPTFQATDVLHEAFVRILESRRRALTVEGDRTAEDSNGRLKGSAKGRAHEDGRGSSESPNDEVVSEERAVATLAAAIRSVLVDRVRRRLVRCRHQEKVAGHASGKPLEKNGKGEGDSLVALDEALNALVLVDARAARVVELRFFAGLSMEHTATLMGMSMPTAERDWRFARAWLSERMDRERKRSEAE